MLLVNLLLIAVVLLALVFQLITPLILNIPAIALCLIALVVAIWHFKRSRMKARVPIFATFTLIVQSLLFVVSIFILVAVTIPHESATDTPEVVLGLRKFLASQGLIDPPRETVKTTAGSTGAEKAAAPVTVNAPDAAKVEIKIEDAAAKEAKPAAANSEPAKEKPATP